MEFFLAITVEKELKNILMNLQNQKNGSPRCSVVLFFAYPLTMGTFSPIGLNMSLKDTGELIQ